MNQVQKIRLQARVDIHRMKANGGDPSSPTQPRLSRNRHAPAIRPEGDCDTVEGVLNKLRRENGHG